MDVDTPMDVTPVVETQLSLPTEIERGLIPVDYVYVADEIALEDAVRELKYAPYVFLDCEGLNLGAVGGSLSLVNIATSEGQVYVVDVVAFDSDEGREVLEPLFELLKSAEIKKVTFDARMDASELMHGYGVELAGVLDLQLADIVSRELRDEGAKQQLSRLVPFVHRDDLRGHGPDYVGVHRLNGLVRCMSEHGLPFARRKEAYHERWRERPLCEEMIAAAARDVQYVRALWTHFAGLGWVAEGALEEQSVRYVVGMVRGMRPYSWDTFRCNGLLPQGVLSVPGDGAAKRTCGLCERALALTCFLRVNGRHCVTCRALRIRKMRQEQRQHGDKRDIWQFLLEDEGRPIPPRGPRARRGRGRG